MGHMRSECQAASHVPERVCDPCNVEKYCAFEMRRCQVVRSQYSGLGWFEHPDAGLHPGNVCTPGGDGYVLDASPSFDKRAIKGGERISGLTGALYVKGAVKVGKVVDGAKTRCFVAGEDRFIAEGDNPAVEGVCA